MYVGTLCFRATRSKALREAALPDTRGEQGCTTAFIPPVRLVTRNLRLVLAALFSVHPKYGIYNLEPSGMGQSVLLVSDGT